MISFEIFPESLFPKSNRETKLAQLEKQAVNYDQKTGSLTLGPFIPTQECWGPLNDPINLFGTDDPTKRVMRHRPGDTTVPLNTPVFPTAELADEYAGIVFGDIN